MPASSSKGKKVKEHLIIPRSYESTQQKWETFSYEIDKIFGTTHLLKSEPGVVPPHRNDWHFMRLVYKFLLDYLDKPKERRISTVLECLANNESDSTKLMYFKYNPFLIALYVLKENAPFLNKKENRSRMANMMAYAYRHKVPPHYLAGFIYQAGGAGAVTKKARDPMAFERDFPIEIGSAD